MGKPEEGNSEVSLQPLSVIYTRDASPLYRDLDNIAPVSGSKDINNYTSNISPNQPVVSETSGSYLAPNQSVGYPQQNYPHFPVGNNQNQLLSPYSSNVLNSQQSQQMHTLHPNQMQQGFPMQQTFPVVQQGMQMQQGFPMQQGIPMQQPSPMQGALQMAGQIVKTQLQTNFISEIPETILKWQRIVNIVCYSILLVAALITMVIYIVLCKRISAKLDLIELGNWWTFLIIFISCAITTTVTAFALALVGFTKAKMNPKLVAAVDFILMLAWFMVAFVGIGVGTSSRQGKHGPETPTEYGKYVMAVCGNEKNSSSSGTKIYFNTGNAVDSTTTTIAAPSMLDPVKCTATTELMFIVLSMYIWLVFAAVISVTCSKFGLGSWRRFGNRIA